MPPPSSWKTPFPSPRWSRAYVAASSSGRCRGEVDRVPRGSGSLMRTSDGRGQAREMSSVRVRSPSWRQRAGLLDVPHVPPGGDDLLVLVLVRQPLERHEILQRSVGDHHARRVRARSVSARALRGVGRSRASFGRPPGLPRPADGAAALPRSPLPACDVEHPAGRAWRPPRPFASGIVQRAWPTSFGATRPWRPSCRTCPIWATFARAVLLADVLDDLDSRRSWAEGSMSMSGRSSARLGSRNRLRTGGRT